MGCNESNAAVSTTQWCTQKGGWGVETTLFWNRTLVFKVKCPNYASAVRAVISKQLWQNLPHIILKPNRLVGVVVRDVVISAGMDGSRGDAPPYQPFSNIFFDEYSFSIISNLFDDNMLYALSTHNRKCMDKVHHIWWNTQIYGQKI